MDPSTPARPESPDEQLLKYADRLVVAVTQAVPAWAVWHLERLGGSGRWDQAELEAVGARARDAAVARLRNLLSCDIDEQSSTPLSVLASIVAAPTEFLQVAGVAPIARDPFDAARDPGDLYGLIPRTWSDLGDEVADAGMTWGAAKAYVHLARRRELPT